MEEKVDAGKDECGGLVTQWGAAEAGSPSDSATSYPHILDGPEMPPTGPTTSPS